MIAIGGRRRAIQNHFALPRSSLFAGLQASSFMGGLVRADCASPIQPRTQYFQIWVVRHLECSTEGLMIDSNGSHCSNEYEISNYRIVICAN